MSDIGPCDISASLTNSLIRQRLAYIQSAAVTHPPGYGFPYVAPERLQITCMSMNFTQAAEKQAAYKKSVLSSKNANSFVATKQQQLIRILNGFTANGQPSAQYATQNWTFTSSNTKDTPQFDNNTIGCKAIIGNVDWFSVAVNFDAEKIVATSVNGGIYYSTNKGQTWTNSYLPNVPVNYGIGPTPYLVSANNNTLPTSNYISLNAKNALYKSFDFGASWNYMKDTSGSLITQFTGFVGSENNNVLIYMGYKSIGTSMFYTKHTNPYPYPPGFPTQFIQDNTLPLYSAPNNYVQFSALASHSDLSFIWACGNCNPSYIPPGYLNSAPGYYIWRGVVDSSNVYIWANGVNPASNIQNQGGPSPTNPGVYISLHVIITDALMQRVAVAGYRNPTANFTPNFWIQPSYVIPPGPTTFSSVNYFAGITSAYDWYALAMSPDGMIIVASSAENTALGNIGYIYVSTDGGSTGYRTSATSGVWTSLAISSDGSPTIVAISSSILQGITLVQGGFIYISSDLGLSWIKSNTLLI